MSGIRVSRREQQAVADRVNAVWGTVVAWVERARLDTLDVEDDYVVRSKLIGGKLPGRKDVPPFFPGPATGRMFS